MKQPLTKRQRETLTIIERSVLDKGYVPTLAELADDMKIGRSTVQGFLKELEIKGYLKRIPNKARALILSKEQRIEAGPEEININLEALSH